MAANGPAARSKFQSAILNLVVLGVGLLLSLLLLEVLLRLHNPFQSRIKGNRIVLTTNQQFSHPQRYYSDVGAGGHGDAQLALGFRGPNPLRGFR